MEAVKAVLLVAGVMWTLDAFGERMVLRNGLILTNNGFVRASRVLSLRGAPNLALVDGRVMERDVRNPFVFRPIGIGRDSLQVQGATRRGTADQVGNLLQRIIDRMPESDTKNVFDSFLKRNGFTGATPRGAGGGGNKPAAGVAQPGTPGTSDLAGEMDPGACRNMVGSVCSGNSGVTIDQSAFQQEQRFLSSFTQNTGRGMNAVIGSAQRLMAGRDDGIFKSYLDFLKNNLPDMTSAVNKIREELMTAVNEQEGFSAQTKVTMNGELARQRFLLTPPLSDPRHIQAWMAACTPTGFGTNAFAAIGQGFIVICPGLLAAINAVGGTGELEDRLRLTVAHELTHQIGADRSLLFQRQQFTTTAACFVNNFNGVSPGMSAEIVADHMAAESIGLELQRRGLRGTAALNLLRRSLQPLCLRGGGGDGQHPSNQFRIATIAGRNPRVLAAVCGQQPTIDRPSCTTAGLVGRNGSQFLAQNEGGSVRTGAAADGAGQGHALGLKNLEEAYAHVHTHDHDHDHAHGRGGH